MKGDTFDPKNLIADAYAIEGITPGECRSVFLDWVLGIPAEADTSAYIAEMLRRHDAAFPDHPMTEVLREGGRDMATPRRRGGWRSRTRQ